jgi:hypothetical protein
LDLIPVSVLFHILSHHLLVISSEDSLFSYIRSRICSDAESLDLLQFVRFKYLSSDCIFYFLSDLPSSIDRRLWESISRRLIPPPELKFPLRNVKALDGIISYLTRKHGGNVHDKGIVTITSKSVASDHPSRPVRNVADFSKAFIANAFLSQSEPDEWVCWDFHEMRVRRTHYAINSYLLKSWVVESSLDDEHWVEFDRKTDSNDFARGGRVASFAVATSADCRFIWLTQTGRNQHRNDCLLIAVFEVFGTLLE